jgi:hypothetical protein
VLQGSSYRIVNFGTSPEPSPSFDVGPITVGNSGTSGTGGSAGQFTPLGVTTMASGALAFQVVTSNTTSGTLAFFSANSWTFAWQEEPFGTNQVGFAYRSVTGASGAPTWVNGAGNVAWTAITDSLKP